MNVQLAVDLSSLTQAIDQLAQLGQGPDPAILQNGMMEVAEYVRQTWVAAVSGGYLQGMTGVVNSDKYAQGLATGQSIQMTGPLAAVVVCTWDGAWDIEKGKAAYDMKPGLLNGPHHKIGKDGTPYNTVPFRHGTPQTGARAGTPRQNMPEMPQSVYNVVRKGTTYATGAGQIPLGLRTKLAVGVNAFSGLPVSGGGMPSNYAWKSGMYEGLSKRGRAGHSQYLTFRRVSQKSNPASWWHPGTRPNPIREAVVEAVRGDVNSYLIDVVKRAYGIP